jgi:hypothetical protein
MKTRHVLLGLGVALMVAGTVLSCSLAPVSIDERIASFIAHLNSTDRSSLPSDFHPTLTTDVVSGAIYVYDWNIPFPLTGITYSISGVNESDPSNVTGTIIGAGPFGTVAIKFVMAQTGISDWRIQELWLGGSQLIK